MVAQPDPLPCAAVQCISVGYLAWAWCVRDKSPPFWCWSRLLAPGVPRRECAKV